MQCTTTGLRLGFMYGVYGEIGCGVRLMGLGCSLSRGLWRNRVWCESNWV